MANERNQTLRKRLRQADGNGAAADHQQPDEHGVNAEHGDLGTAGPTPGPVTFVIPGRLPGTNEISWEERTHWSKGYKFRRKWTQMVGACVIAGRVPFYRVPVAVGIVYIERDRRRDCDNIHGGAKFILDALKETGRIPNDSRRWVRSCTPVVAEPDKDNPRIQVTVSPLAKVPNDQQDRIPSVGQTDKSDRRPVQAGAVLKNPEARKWARVVRSPG
jgi:Holliday junction resolvase RusA-like endonuclease